MPRLLLNRELVGPFKQRHKRATDLAMTGDLVESVEELVRAAGWEGELRALQGSQEQASDSATEDQLPSPRSRRGTVDVLPPPSSIPGCAELAVAVSELSIKEGVDVSADKDTTLDETESSETTTEDSESDGVKRNLNQRVSAWSASKNKK